ELKGSSGLEIGVPAGCVPTEIHLAHSFSTLPDAQTAMDSLQLLGRIHDIKPFGIPLKNLLRLRLPMPVGVGAFSRVLNKPQSAFSIPLDATEYVAGFWNPTTLQWEIMPIIGADTDHVTVEVSQLGRYAVFQASEPLGIRDVRFSANPFSPEIAPLEISYRVTSSASTVLWVSVRIYTMTGDPVVVLMKNAPQNKGMNSVFWDGTTTSGGNGLNGRYVVQIRVKDNSGEKEILKSVVLIK
ncbi:hypothetical protein KAH55_10440, partial [bacterium]|nr:hypothetical protein [bacterium]